MTGYRVLTAAGLLVTVQADSPEAALEAVFGARTSAAGLATGDSVSEPCVSDEAIQALRAEACLVGDEWLETQCNNALRGNAAARRVCCEVL